MQKVGEPPPAPAQAGKVLTAEKDPNEPEDFTDQGFTTGDGERYSGGTTTSTGTSKTAVPGPVAKKGGVEGGKGTNPIAQQGPSTTADSSKPAVPVSRNWNCGFPPEADFDQIDYATVTISVTVGTDGRAKSVNIMSDPGHGFGRLAKSCAMRMQYNVGLDKDGNPVVKTTSPFPVRFTR
jgi:protein TonB